MIEGISAITLATHDMSRAVRFYRMLGFEIMHGGEDAAFTSFRAGTSYLNLIAQPAERKWSWWGRGIFYHSDVDGGLGRLSPRYGAPRCRMGRAVLPPNRSRWSRAQLRLAAEMRLRHCQRADPPWRRLGAPFQWRSYE
jgi:catechol 2,3-dioxygenase-like lactoylglutathione lyase family enzyme